MYCLSFREMCKVSFLLVRNQPTYVDDDNSFCTIFLTIIAGVSASNYTVHGKVGVDRIGRYDSWIGEEAT